MHGQDIEYTVDGTRHVGYLVVDDERSGRRPAVLVAHEGPGLDDHARQRAARLAELGYVAFALDYHGEGRRLAWDDMRARLAWLREEPERMRALARAGLDVLLTCEAADPARVAAIGYCFGGTLVLELARSGAAPAERRDSVPSSGRSPSRATRERGESDVRVE